MCTVHGCISVQMYSHVAFLCLCVSLSVLIVLVFCLNVLDNMSLQEEPERCRLKSLVYYFIVLRCHLPEFCNI